MVYVKKDANHKDVTLVAVFDSDGNGRAWFAVNLTERKILARQSGFATVDTYKRIGYRRVM